SFNLSANDSKEIHLSNFVIEMKLDVKEMEIEDAVDVFIAKPPIEHSVEHINESSKCDRKPRSTIEALESTEKAKENESSRSVRHATADEPELAADNWQRPKSYI